MIMKLNGALLILTLVHGAQFMSGRATGKSEDPIVVVHKKDAGEGYSKGSPLYNATAVKEDKGLAAAQKMEEAKAKARKAAKSGKSGVPPVSTTMKCVMNLTIQYFIVMTVMAVLRTCNEILDNRLAQAEKVVAAAVTTVSMAPMLCVLFLGVRMRAVQLSGGEPDKYDLPQPWVKIAMESCAYAVLAQTVLVVAVPIVMGTVPETSAAGTPKLGATRGNWAGMVLSVLGWLVALGLYAGFTTVIAGVALMKPAKEVYPDEVPAVSPAVKCTIDLTCQYFLAYLALGIHATYQQFVGETDRSRHVGALLNNITTTVHYAPMLCILFIGARIRALQIDPVDGAPQSWAQTCFYLCTWSILSQLVLIVVAGFFTDTKIEQGDIEGDVKFVPGNQKTVFYVLEGLRYTALLALYGGFTAVLVSVHVIENPNGKTPDLSPAMMCVMTLASVFFIVYLGNWIFVLIRQFAKDPSSGSSSRTPILRMFEAMKGVVQYSPMLATLFLGLRMRALEITDNKGAPQGWAQQAMYLSTGAILLQVLMVVLSGLDTSMREGKGSGGVVSNLLIAVRYIALAALYSGVVMVMVALFKITPETATGEGGLITIDE